MTHQCPVCLKGFEFASKLQRHQLIHSGHRPFVCTLCGKAFRQAAHLKKHLEIHVRAPLADDIPLQQNPPVNVHTALFHVQGVQEAFPLPPCPSPLEEFPTQSVQAGAPGAERPGWNLQEWDHSDWTSAQEVLQEPGFNSFAEKNEESLEGQAYHCTICQKFFSSFALLQDHCLVHVGETSPETSSQMAEMDLQTYDNVRLRPSSFDPRPVSDKGSRQRFSRGVTRLSHQCPECPKSFSAPSKLRRHCLIHTGQRPFQCLECGKTFRQLPHLKSHQETHKKAQSAQRRPCQPEADYSQDIELQVGTLDYKPPSAVSPQPQSPQEEKPLDSHLLSSVERALTVPSDSPHLPREQPLDEDFLAPQHAGEVKAEESGVCQVPVQVGVAGSRALGYRCGVCSESFSSPSKLRRHSLTHFQCAVCGQGFLRAASLRKHLCAHGDPVACPRPAGRSGRSPTPTAMQLELNIMVKSEPWRQNIDEEARTPTASPGLAEPTQRSSGGGGKTHRCATCLRDFSAPSKLRRHVLTHTGQRPFSCQLCGKRFRQQAHVKLHTRTHFSPRHARWKKTERNSPLLRVNVDDRAPPSPTPKPNARWEGRAPERKLEPEVSPEVSAGRTAPSARGLTRGGARSARSCGYRKLQCSLCLKVFAYPSKLQRHLLIHTGQKPFRCLACGKTFRQAVHLKVHQQTHSARRPFKCAVQKRVWNSIRCDARGRHHSRGSLPRGQGALVDVPRALPPCGRLAWPMRSGGCEVEERVTGKEACARQVPQEKPGIAKVPRKPRTYGCAVCLKHFSAPSKLRRHSLTHTGQRPFQCPVCHQAFRQLAHLKAHHSAHVCTRSPGSMPGRKQASSQGRPLEIVRCNLAGEGTQDNLSVSLPEGRASPPPRNPDVETPTDGQGPRLSYTCCLCVKDFDCPSKLQRHYLTHTGHKPFTCCVCGCKFQLRAHLKRHQRSHSGTSHPAGPGQFLSAGKAHVLCDQAYTSQRASEESGHSTGGGSHSHRSQNAQHCALPLMAEECEFNRQWLSENAEGVSEYGDSVGVEPPPEPRLIAECGEYLHENDGFPSAAPHSPCDRDPSDEGAEVVPEPSVASPVSWGKCPRARGHQCAVCLKVFAFPSKLSRHMLIHTGAKPFRCLVCGKAFRQLSHLRSHQQLHKGAPTSAALVAASGAAVPPVDKGDQTLCHDRASQPARTSPSPLLSAERGVVNRD